MAKNVEIQGRKYEEILLGSSVYKCVIACRYLAYRHFFFFFGSGTKCAQLHNVNKLSLQSQVIQKSSKETFLYQ